MLNRSFRSGAMLFAAAVVAMSLLVDVGSAQVLGRQRVDSDLFYNFYVPPGNSGVVGAQLYPSPRPAPPWVGYTYYTYQPLMPHEFLYRHHRTYVRCYPGQGWTRTFVWWQ